MPILRKAHPGKKLEIETDAGVFYRFPVRTSLIREGDDLVTIFLNEVGDDLKSGDIILVAESVIAVVQKRAYPIRDIKPSFFARLLSRFVTKTKHGIGLGMPETMELAIREVGLWRILLAALVHVIMRLFGRRGWFYRVAGEKARGIDGPTPGTIPPYNEYATLIPENPGEYAKKMEKEITSNNPHIKEVKVIVIDANDLGVNILGEKDKNWVRLAEELAHDNPLGQGSESTPFLLCRKQGGE